MPRAIWSGSISFGLVNVPVRLMSATRDLNVRFNQLHEKDNGRIRYKRVCEVCGEVVEYRDIAKASLTGPATNIIAGLAVGKKSVALPIGIICVTIWVAFHYAGLYGLALGYEDLNDHAFLRRGGEARPDVPHQ